MAYILHSSMNYTPPIDALPVEVMEVVFQAAVDSGQQPETLGAISRRWRDIATGCRLLWCEINILPEMFVGRLRGAALEYVRRRIQRSIHYGLSVTIRFPSHSSVPSLSGTHLGARFPSFPSQGSLFRDAMEAVVGPQGSVMQRWKQLSLGGPMADFPQLSYLLQYPTPALQEFKLLLPYDCARNTVANILPQTPQLRLLEVYIPTHVILPHSLRQVPKLVLSGTHIYHSHDLLVPFSSLTFLELNTIFTKPHSAHNSSTLQLPHLRTLCIRYLSGNIYSFLIDAVMPVLESLHLHLSTHLVGNSNAGPKARRLLGHILPRLLNLTISEMDVRKPEELVGLLEPAKNLRSLHLEGCGSWKQWLRGVVLEQRLMREHYYILHDSSLCPNLRSCVIEGHERHDLIAIRNN